MALVLGDNFSYGGAKPLDARLKYNTLAEMKAVADSTMYDGCTAYCKEADKTYQWKSTNTVDENTGKWREFSSGGGGSSYTAGDGIEITNDVISTKQSEEGDIDKIIDVYPTAGNLVSIVNAFNKGDIYSTQERMIGQWQNGKPLYQKTVSCGALPNNTTKSIDLNVSNIETITSCKGVAISSVTILELPHVTTSDSKYFIEIYYDTSHIYIATKYDYSTYTSSYVTIQYTKTTDTAISIGEATEYSTDEKVVGTWIDGRPIYQRTYEQEIELTPNTWVASSLAATNVNKVINCIGYNAGSSIDCMLGGIVNGYFGLNSVRSDSITINAFTVQYLKTTT